ncbi:hypothetical protein MA16_Dca026368 [Dendrobium catenatum]|uniref:Uncharacterized protein n=1 Tax=Dendrobium catenatum TaxID=906689 RepID=A0A2I0WXI9_9ASPA|nr:hypothetical protein MA16_Dca026368 [Dendrobium catenatum]
MISTCDLHDIGFFGNAYTWNRDNLWQSLDRVLFNNDWIAKFQMTHVEHLSRTASDHAPLLLSINANKDFFPTAFKFQNMWLSHHDFLNVFERNWQAPLFPIGNISGMAKLWSKLSRLNQVLRWWNKHTFKNIFDNIKNAEHKVMELEKIYQLYPDSSNLSDLNVAKINLCTLQEQEEIYWHQKATTKFTVDGDRNTKFFHALANKKKIRNHIFKITSDDGRVLEEEDSILSSDVDHFKNIFNSGFQPTPIVNPHIVSCCISEADNFQLTIVPSEEEVWKVM